MVVDVAEAPRSPRKPPRSSSIQGRASSGIQVRKSPPGAVPVQVQVQVQSQSRIQSRIQKGRGWCCRVGKNRVISG